MRDVPTSLTTTLLTWFSHHGRHLPWREPGTSPWSILVCEVMSQQTPVSRVVPRWHEWQQRWPTPADLAAADRSDVLRAWDRLGYPRRAIRLHECAKAVVERFGGKLPTDVATLLTLPGIGQYTAAAVAAFAGGHRVVVADTNIRRVLARLHGEAGVPAHLRRFELERAERMLPQDPEQSVVFNEALMELGALVCTARNPECESCPLQPHCQWFAAGKPADPTLRSRTQSWHGTDRQARGAIMAQLRLLRDHQALPREDALTAASSDVSQAERALSSLIADGLAQEDERGWIRLASSR